MLEFFSCETHVKKEMRCAKATAYVHARVTKRNVMTLQESRRNTQETLNFKG
jgi:hypothetical protein